MSKKFWSVLAAGALVATVFSALPARAAEVPAEVQIDDPAGDANGLNDQDNAYGTPLAGQGDHVGPADVGSATDLLKVWFSHTASDISLNFQTEGNPNNLAYDTYFRFASNPGSGPVAASETRGCLWWIGSVNGAGGGYTGETQGTLEDECNVDADPAVGPLETSEGPDGTFVTTMTFPRSYSPLLADGGTIAAPFGVVRVAYVGPTPTTAAVVTMDNTQRGTDYEISSDDGVISEPPVMEEPPVVKEPKKQNCSKIANKKKRQKCIKRNKKLSKPQGCAAYVPGEMGAEVETDTTIITDEATEEAPIEIEVPIGQGLTSLGGPTPDLASRVKHNIQIDSKAAEAGLFAKLESPATDDPDLYVYWDNGTQAAVAGGFNQILVPGHPANPFDGTGSGGHSGLGYEQIDGLRTADCAGWTLDLVNWLGQGGTYTLKLWVGEIQNDPAPRE